MIDGSSVLGSAAARPGTSSDSDTYKPAARVRAETLFSGRIPRSLSHRPRKGTSFRVLPPHPDPAGQDGQRFGVDVRTQPTFLEKIALDLRKQPEWPLPGIGARAHARS